MSDSKYVPSFDWRDGTALFMIPSGHLMYDTREQAEKVDIEEVIIIAEEQSNDILPQEIRDYMFENLKMGDVIRAKRAQDEGESYRFYRGRNRVKNMVHWLVGQFPERVLIYGGKAFPLIHRGIETDDDEVRNECSDQLIKMEVYPSNIARDMCVLLGALRGAVEEVTEVEQPPYLFGTN